MPGCLIKGTMVQQNPHHAVLVKGGISWTLSGQSGGGGTRQDILHVICRCCNCGELAWLQAFNFITQNRDLSSVSVPRCSTRHSAMSSTDTQGCEMMVMHSVINNRQMTCFSCNSINNVHCVIIVTTTIILLLQTSIYGLRRMNLGYIPLFCSILEGTTHNRVLGRVW